MNRLNRLNAIFGINDWRLYAPLGLDSGFVFYGYKVTRWKQKQMRFDEKR